MIEEILARPDITLTIDGGGVIQSAVSSDTLAGERLEDWHGRAWKETVDIGRQVARIIEHAQRGVSSCFQVNQRLPSGRELPVEYTTIGLGDKAGFIAIGRNLQTISDLQSRLASAQQAREQDYWKLRDVETRYRALLDASSEAVVLVRVSNLRVVEANVAASKTLGLVPGGEFYPEMPARDRRTMESMFAAVRRDGRAPGIALHLSNSAAPWSLRASLLNSEAGAFYLLQMTPLSAGPQAGEGAKSVSVDEIVRRLPDGFVVVDRLGIIQRANDTFLDLAQVGVEGAVLGRNLKRWLSRPGADVGVVLAIVQSHGSVMMMPTVIEGELGGITDVEVSATGERTAQPNFVGLLLRDTRGRARPTSEARATEVEAPDPGASLESIVKASVESIERKNIEAALAKCGGNRTLAAKRLGLSRQSLHTKLNKYKIDLD